MKCPYCAEKIQDEAIVCRYCWRDLSFFKLNKPILKRIDQLENKVFKLERRPANDNRTQSPDGNSSASSAVWIAIKNAIDASVAEAAQPKRIMLAVLLSASIQVLSNQIWNFFNLIPSPVVLQGWSNLLAGGVFSIATILATALRVGSVYPPLVFGFWASLAWPRRHLFGYLLLGMLAGGLTLFGNLTLELLGGVFQLPTDPQFSWKLSCDRECWEISLLISFVGPALMFVSGAILGDLVKLHKHPDRELQGGLTNKVLSRIFGSRKEPSTLAVFLLDVAKLVSVNLAGLWIALALGLKPLP